MPARVLAAAIATLVAQSAASEPMRIGLDAPILAHEGAFSVGAREIEVVQADQVLPARSVEEEEIVRGDRALRLLVWYPTDEEQQEPIFYQASLSAEPPLPRKWFNIEGLATRDAEPAQGSFPVILISHGFANDPAMMHWMGENLATKGYVVVAPAHEDPDYSNPHGGIESQIRRPLDIAFVLGEIRDGLLGDMADVETVGLIGYSRGGEGVLTAAGAELDPEAEVFEQPVDLLGRYLAGGEEAGLMDAGEIDAVVAIAPPLSSGGIWGEEGLASLQTPLMMIAGSADRTVGYENGPRAIYEAALNAPRTMLVFQMGGHNVGTGAIPDEMRGTLWDMDWFADPVWRKDRMNSISLHFLTAFLDLHLKDDEAMAAYLDVSDPLSDEAVWDAPYEQWDQAAEGGDNPAWLGFKRYQQVGLELHRLDAAD